MNIRRFFKLDCIRYSSITIFCVFAITIFIKCILSHFFDFNYIALTSLWKSPLDFFAFYFSKLLPAILLASPVFILKNTKWTIYVSFIIDFWIIANEIYYRINGIYLDVDTIFIANNLNGFWSSILPFINIKDSIYLIITICYIIVWKQLCITKQKSTKAFIGSIFLCVLFILFDLIFGYGSNRNPDFKESPLQTTVRSGKGLSARTLNSNFFVERGSILHYPFCYIIYRTIRYSYEKNNFIAINELDEEQISSLINYHTSPSAPSFNLLIIIVESLESWTLDCLDEQGEMVTPNLNHFFSKDNILAKKIKSQARAGSSGDGQMIFNTGLLPISSGAACMLYGNNSFPNIANIYKNSIVIDPCAGNVWNQVQMTKAYGYTTLYPQTGKGGDDSWVMSNISTSLDTIKEPFCCQGITISSHTPFDIGSKTSLILNKEMPKTLKKYLGAIHYADSCIGKILHKLENDSLLDNTIVVITGDHTIFKSSMLKDFNEFSSKYNYPIPQEESYCPLIIHSPNIKGSVIIDELCYQMDIFPTIMHCIGAEDYYWKGFGVNLLDSVARNNRSISEEDAYSLSDKMIRSNYFKQYESNK